jgi:hypothetical protein
LVPDRARNSHFVLSDADIRSIVAGPILNSLSLACLVNRISLCLSRIGITSLIAAASHFPPIRSIINRPPPASSVPARRFGVVRLACLGACILRLQLVSGHDYHSYCRVVPSEAMTHIDAHTRWPARVRLGSASSLFPPRQRTAVTPITDLRPLIPNPMSAPPQCQDFLYPRGILSLSY